MWRSTLLLDKNNSRNVRRTCASDNMIEMPLLLLFLPNKKVSSWRVESEAIRGNVLRAILEAEQVWLVKQVRLPLKDPEPMKQTRNLMTICDCKNKICDLYIEQNNSWHQSLITIFNVFLIEIFFCILTKFKLNDFCNFIINLQNGIFSSCIIKNSFLITRLDDYPKIISFNWWMTIWQQSLERKIK